MYKGCIKGLYYDGFTLVLRVFFTFHVASETKEKFDPAVILTKSKGALLAMPWFKSPYAPHPAEAQIARTFFSPGFSSEVTL